MWVQRRRGLGALEDGMSDTAWAQSARSQPPACWSRLPAGHWPMGRLRASHKYSLCWWQAAARMELSVQDGTAQCQDWGVLDSEADRPKVIFLQKR
jgi:hypothetical protein